MKNLQRNAHCDLMCDRDTVEYMQLEVINTPSPPSPPLLLPQSPQVVGIIILHGSVVADVVLHTSMHRRDMYTCT